jgi:hypothetical protein
LSSRQRPLMTCDTNANASRKKIARQKLVDLRERIANASSIPPPRELDIELFGYHQKTRLLNGLTSSVSAQFKPRLNLGSGNCNWKQKLLQ